MYYNLECACVSSLISESPTGIVDFFIYLFILGPVAFNKCILWAYLYEQDQPG